MCVEIGQLRDYGYQDSFFFFFLSVSSFSGVIRTGAK